MTAKPATPVQVPQLIAGEFRQSRSTDWIEVTDPATQAVIARVPCATDEEMAQAIASAKEAFKTWRNVPVPTRARVMLKYQELLKAHHDELATILAKETGKTFEDAKGDVWRGIEVVEHAANIPSLLMGETVEVETEGSVVRRADNDAAVKFTGLTESSRRKLARVRDLQQAQEFLRSQVHMPEQHAV